MQHFIFSDSDNDSYCTSFYPEQDHFDYLYSGGSTQYSDPVYEAVNKLDKSAVSPNGKFSFFCFFCLHHRKKKHKRKTN